MAQSADVPLDHSRSCASEICRATMPAQAERCGELHAAPAGADSGSLMTRRWRGVDSNFRFRARAGSILPVRFVADSLLERTGFELLVSSARDGFQWVSLQFAVASRLSQQGLSCRQLQDQRRVIRNPGNPLLMGIVDAAGASSQLL
jgi:hypothetical protein